MERWKATSIGLAVLTIGAALAGCGSKSASTDAGTPEQVKAAAGGSQLAPSMQAQEQASVQRQLAAEAAAQANNPKPPSGPPSQTQ